MAATAKAAEVVKAAEAREGRPFSVERALVRGALYLMLAFGLLCATAKNHEVGNTGLVVAAVSLAGLAASLGRRPG